MRAFAIAILVSGCGGPAPSAIDPSEALLGGDTTIFDDGDEAFAYPLRNMGDDQRALFQIGDGLFNRNWVAAPATPQGNDGLGPTYNAISCAACHDNNGRGATPTSPTDPFLGLLLRLSLPGKDAHGGPLPDPNYGDQLNQFAILGVPNEGTPSVSYVEQAGTYGDGSSYSLRVPTYTISDLHFGPLGDGYLVSPRIAPQMVGLGLLEAVDESTIAGFATQNGGHENHVWDTAGGQLLVGRFGWKANQPSLEQQTFGAFHGDIGITSVLFPQKNCPPAQTACANALPSLTQPNLSAMRGDAMAAHALGLAIPARRNLDDPSAQHGEQLFTQFGCATCHIPTMTTGALAGWDALSHQKIHPFTDLLLHDMGPDLADDRPDFEAGGSEWRTPPLWGLGLVQPIDGYLFLLHDGRARGFEEAILWHGGQGATARDAFRTATKSDRDSLIAFLQSL